jgi:FMN phosphatase YigB (HAD superfamily)
MRGMISFVYFDVGGVANLDFSGTNKWDDLRAELGVTPDNRAAYDALWAEYYPKLCTSGDVEDLVPRFRDPLGLHLPADYSLLNAFVSRFEPNPAIWPAVDEIQRQVPVGLLTNMYKGMFDAIQKTGMLPQAPWAAIVDSSVEGCQKPEARIFQIAQARAGVPADNSPEHVDAAKALGWQTFLYDTSNPQQSSEELSSYFKDHLATD